MKKIIAIVSLSLFLQSCETTRYLNTTGGSKSDGIVEMSFEHGAFENPQIQWADAKLKAAKTCQAWGYSSATPFGQGESKCVAVNEYGCIRWKDTYKYQCVD